MKKRKRILSLLLSLLMLLSCVGVLAACGGEEAPPGEDSGTGAESAQESEAPPPEPVKLVDNGVSEYVIVYPDGASGVVTSAMDKLVKKIHDTCGVMLTTKSDFLRRGQEADPEAKEILFGKTNRAETRQALADITGSDSYTITQIGNKLVMVSPNDSSMLGLVNYYIKNLFEKNLVTDEASGKKTLFFEGYTYLSGKDEENPVMYLGGRELYDYRIVYTTTQNGYKDAALYLQKVIADSTGYALVVAPDTTEQTDCEILVGNTKNRAFSAECYKRDSNQLMCYEVAMSGSTLQIISGGPFSARMCADQLLFEVFDQNAEPLKDGYHFKTELTSPVGHTSGTDMRVMSYNILADMWAASYGDDAPSVEQRAEVLAGLLLQYQPDAMGLQEVDTAWRLQIEAYLEILKADYGLEYSFVWGTYQGSTNMTAILYRSDTWNVTDSGLTQYSVVEGNPGYYIRVAAWAQFERKDGSDEFLLLNTHWPPEDGSFVERCAEEQVAVVNELTEKGVPLILTGDFNESIGGTVLPDFLTNAGVTDLRAVAEASGTLLNNASGIGAPGETRGAGGGIIDQILGKGGNLRVLRFETVCANRMEFGSDHSPMLADIRLDG